MHSAQLNELWRQLLHMKDKASFPNDELNNLQWQEPMLIKKLGNGDTSWSTIKTTLGWMVDMEAGFESILLAMA